jgi:membrane-associated protein
MHWLYHIIRYTLVHWGYWAILAGLGAENAGLPLPGETILMFASFLAHKQTGLSIVWVIVVGAGSAILGDNAGFFLGRHFGRHLIRWMKKLFHIDDEDMGAAKDQIRHHGAATIFWARYVFGLRTIAGPLAGMLGMEWKKFLLFNVLGAVTWVTGMAFVGYAFSNEFDTLLGFFEKVSWIMALALFIIGYLLWRRQKKRYRERHARKAA